MTDHIADLKGRIPSLDGLRGIAILLVLAGHLSMVEIGTVPEAINLGFLGVTIFFVLSGFLITRLLLDEWMTRGKISLGAFYLRRTFRLLPAYYALIAVVSLGYLSGFIKTPQWGNILIHALTYTTNYGPQFFWYLGHTWTLGIEEQFYLLWPFLLWKTGPRCAFGLAALSLVLCPIFRFYYASLPGPHVVPFEIAADFLAMGCLLAGGREYLQRNAWYRTFLGIKVLPLFLLLAMIYLGLGTHFPPFLAPIRKSLLLIDLAIIVDWCLTYPGGRIGRLLNARPLVYLGLISYSVYLWQQLFLNPVTNSPLARFPLNLLLVGAASLASFYLIERPCLRLRNRFLKPHESRQPAPPLPVP